MFRHEWVDNLEGFYIVDCAIRSDDIAYLLVVQDDSDDSDDSDEEWRVISWAPNILIDRNISLLRAIFYNLKRTPKIEVQYSAVDSRCILADGRTFSWSSGPNGGVEEQPGLMKQMRTIGDHVYLLNSFSLSKRNGHTNEWEAVPLHPAILEDYNDETTKKRRYLLIDFDAFSTNEFYLLDWKGKVFYQENNEWHLVDLTAMGYPELQTDGICCGPDGWVYIFGKDENGGKIFQGKGDRWKVIWEVSFEIYHIDMVAYQDHVIITNNFLFSKIKDGVVEHIEGAPFSGKFVSVRGNLLMIADSDEAAIFDGKEWKMIISPHFDEEGNYHRPRLSFSQDEVALLDQVDYALSEEGQEALAETKMLIDSMDEESLNDLRKNMYEAVKKHKNKG